MGTRNKSLTQGRRTRIRDDASPDLFAEALGAAVKAAFEATKDDSSPTPEPESRASTPMPSEPTSAFVPEVIPPTVSQEEPLPARMLNEYVYCPRLFYYEHVEGVFADNADTLKGSSIHKKVDSGNGALKPAEEESSADDKIHSRSVSLGSERLGVVAKLDLVEGDGSESGTMTVCPVDYKVGSPRENEDGLELWPTDKMQLGLQVLLLRDNGYSCDRGVIYYRGTKQRVELSMAPELESWILEQRDAARNISKGPIPPPLIDSPKCGRCSLNGICLPDETNLLQNKEAQADVAPPRRLMAPREETRVLYLNTPGTRVGRKDEVLTVKDENKVIDQVRANDLSHVALFGNIQISTQAIQLLCEKEIPVTYFSMGGWFYGITRGHGLKNIFTRMEQFRKAADPATCLALARQFVFGKIRNHRTMLMRLHSSPPAETVSKLKYIADSALRANSLEELLGTEGAAASLYFQEFNGLLKAKDEIEEPESPAPDFVFEMNGRNRRPPTDPVNALLSLAYSLLSKDCTLAASAVGLDPYLGFYHQPRFGRPALALDVMEEFRPLIAESAVLTCINNGMIQPCHFLRAGKAVSLTKDGRKIFFQAYEQRMNSVITHPIFDYKASYRRVIELQFRLLARFLTNEIPEYPPFLTR